jgi:hypothetical protein
LKNNINPLLASILHNISQEHLIGAEMMTYKVSTHGWPEDPAWPDPYGNDPYDITNQ